MGFKDKKKSSENEASTENAEVRDADFSALEDGAGSSSSSGGGNSHDDAAIAKLKAEVDEHKDKYLRALAELENYKKRALKDRSDLLKYQGERIVYDLLEVVDNLEWAISHSSADPAKLKAGLELTYKLFVDALGRWEIRQVPAMGKEFDPSQHQAISKVFVDDAKPGTVINESKKAYFYKDKLLRPADVVVAVAKEPAADEGATSSGASGDAGEEDKADQSN